MRRANYAMFVLDRGRTGLAGLQSLLDASGGGIHPEVAASVTTFLLAGCLDEARVGRTAGEAMRTWPPPGPKTSACSATTAPRS